MLAQVLLAVEDVPQFRALVLWVPLSELIPVREKSLLCPRLFLIAARSAYSCIKLVVLQGVEQGDGLQLVA